MRKCVDVSLLPSKTHYYRLWPLKLQPIWELLQPDREEPSWKWLARPKKTALLEQSICALMHNTGTFITFTTLGFHDFNCKIQQENIHFLKNDKILTSWKWSLCTAPNHKNNPKSFLFLWSLIMGVIYFIIHLFYNEVPTLFHPQNVPVSGTVAYFSIYFILAL